MASPQQQTESLREAITEHLFAGYGSMRAAAKQKGLNYLAVDWRDFISGSRLHKATATGKED